MSDDRGHAGTLARAHAAVERRAWADAAGLLHAADGERPLELDDLESLATAHHLLDDRDEALAALARAHREALRAGLRTRAARHAFWQALMLMDLGRNAQAAGWIARGQRVLSDQPRSVEDGYLLVPEGIQALASGDVDGANDVFERVSRIAERFGDPDLTAMARLGNADVLIARAEVRRGVALLDEAMVAVTMDEVSPVVAGIVYCSVIESCQRLFDLRRAQEWTDALARWVEAQPQLVAYRGACLLRRAELMALHGSWQAAVAEVRHARERPGGPGADATVGAAWYQEAEVMRLRGELASAEDAYRQASRHGRSPEPGLALLRLDQGRPAAAAAAIDRVLEERHDPASRPLLLETKVDIALTIGRADAAGIAADELGRIAEGADSPLLSAMAARAHGAVSLATVGGREALGALRRAWIGYVDLDAVYEAARVRVLLGLANRASGDEDAARIELEAARETFERLGARPALRRLAALMEPDRTSGLTAREVEVLRLVATGGTNRHIAARLVISEKTVARHLSNIFTKLGVGSRAAATAYAYEHDLVGRST